MVTGTFARKNVRSQEWKFHKLELSFFGTLTPWNFCFQELSFWNIRSRERKSLSLIKFIGLNFNANVYVEYQKCVLSSKLVICSTENSLKLLSPEAFFLAQKAPQAVWWPASVQF